MDFYKIGPTVIKAGWLPKSCQQFKVQPEGLTKEEKESSVLIEIGKAPLCVKEEVLVSVHDHMNVWKGKKGYWLLEDSKHRGMIKTSWDYCRTACWTEPGNDQEEVLQPLLQVVLECQLIGKGVGILHAACVEKEGMAVAFTGPSGAGKSTKASMWGKALHAAWISGDRPAVDPDLKCVYGVPWDGKEQIFHNGTYPLQAILDVRKSKGTRMHRLSHRQVYELLANQMMVPLWDTELTKKAFEILNNLIKRIPVYRLYADKTETAAIESWKLLSEARMPGKEINKENKEHKDMRLKPGFEITEVVGEYMVIPTGERIADYGGTVVINEVSAFLLKHLKEPVEKEELLELLLEEYDVERDRAQKDLDGILEKFTELGLVE